MEMIMVYCLFTAGILLCNVLENWFREQERFKNRAGAGTNWHTYQYLGWVLTFAAIAVLMFGFEMITAKVLFLTAAIWWIGFDGYLNILKERPFFYRSPESSATLEKVAYWWVKVPILILSIVLFYI